MIEITKGATSQLLHIWVPDTSSSSGGGRTGLVHNTAGLEWHYIRNGDAAITSVTMQTMTVGTWVTGGFKEVDSTDMPGLYELGIPDAALATGADTCTMMVRGASNMPPIPIRVQLGSPVTGDVNVVSVDTDALSADGLSAAMANKIADHLIRRSAASARASSDGDAVSARSLLGRISLMNKVDRSDGANLKIYEEDDSTTFVVIPMTTSITARAVTVLDPPA